MQLIIFSSENSCVIRLSNSGFKKWVKLLKLRISRAMLMSAINLLNFNVLIKNDQQYVFFHPKTLIKTKYKCQEKEKVETQNFI